jgi:23S rRNA-/tRNA-specific pseudouridylate synthase
MARITTKEDADWLTILMERAGFATKTRARKAIKTGEVSVNGSMLKIPSAEVKAGAVVEWQKRGPRTEVKDFDLAAPVSPAMRAATAVGKPVRTPFEIVHEDDHVIAYIKPAGWVFASPNPKVKTSYTAMRKWMERARPELNDVHFVNRIEKESSGICLIAKSLAWRKHLQDNWTSFEKGLYLMVQGHLPPDDILTTFHHDDGKRVGPMKEWPYRTMRATPEHTLLKLSASMDEVPLLLSALRRHKCLLVGKGKEAPDPLGRSGIHLYSVKIQGPSGEVLDLKTRVPRPFLNLVKGGVSPKPEKRQST